MLASVPRRRAAANLARAFSCSPSHLVHSDATTGLYGFDVLKTADGFRRFVDDAIKRSGKLISYISQGPTPMEVLRAMDEISDTVCCVVDSAELCRNTHPDREFVEEAINATVRMNDHLHLLNTNYNLYKAVRNIKKEELLTKEAERAAHSLCIDFEKGGIHLCADKMVRVNQLSTEIAKLAREFNENIITDPGYIDVFPTSRVPMNLRHLTRPILKHFPNGSDGKKACFRIATDQDSLISILRLAHDSEIRRMAYITGNSSPRSNLVVLNKLIATRHELAQILGYKSYAQFVIHPNLATSPEVASSFLQDMSEVVKQKANQEFAAILEFKRKHTGERFTNLEPWDEVYYTGIMKSSLFHIDQAVVASYFPVSQCIEGLKSLTESLFGARFHSCPLVPGESWHPDVMKMSLCHPEEGVLGYLYLDLYSREGKYPGCAHFAIRGGCRKSETEYQVPVVALVCSFSPSHGSSCTVLNHWEVEVLFHEFGHALHSLLSRTDYQHFSGTRVALDFAETPSNLFEYFAWDYRILRTFAKNASGDAIPKKLVDALNGARNMFSASELQRQIFYSLVDQQLFGEGACSIRDTAKLVGEIKSQYTNWTHVEGTNWHARFSHLLNYGAGYYSYLYAKCFASTIWQQVCCEDPLSLETGSAIRNKFLRYGGAEDPAVILQTLAGEDILKSCNGGFVPDSSYLCRELCL